MKLKIWGCRGSISTPGANTVKYGGNTSCYEVRNDNDDLLILDAGTGMREMGLDLMSRGKPIDATVFISHTHWDHIHGYPFFVPVFIPGNKFKIYGPVHYDMSFTDVMKMQMNYAYFPVRLDELRADIEFIDTKESSEAMNIDGGFKVKTMYMNHPVLCIGVRIEVDGKVLVYTGDTEPYYDYIYDDDDDDDDVDRDEIDGIIEEQNQKLYAFLQDADVVLHDAQYTPEEYPSKQGFGHTPMDVALKNVINSGAKRVVFTHHEPIRTDDQIDQLEKEYAAIAKKDGVELSFAREGQTIEI